MNIISLRAAKKWQHIQKEDVFCAFSPEERNKYHLTKRNQGMDNEWKFCVLYTTQIKLGSECQSVMYHLTLLDCYPMALGLNSL